MAEVLTLLILPALSPGFPPTPSPAPQETFVLLIRYPDLGSQISSIPSRRTRQTRMEDSLFLYVSNTFHSIYFSLPVFSSSSHPLAFSISVARHKLDYLAAHFHQVSGATALCAPYFSDSKKRLQYNFERPGSNVNSVASCSVLQFSAFTN